MSAIEPLTTSSSPFVHLSATDSDCCPTCDQPIPSERIPLVKGRLAGLRLELTNAISAEFEQERAQERALDAARIGDIERKAAQEIQAANASVQAARVQARQEIEAAESRLRGDFEQAYQARWTEESGTMQRAHEAALRERDTTAAKSVEALQLQLAAHTQTAAEREQSLNERLAAERQDRAADSEAATEREGALRAQFQQDLAAQLATHGSRLQAAYQLQLDAANAKLGEANRDRQAAIDSSNSLRAEFENEATKRLSAQAQTMQADHRVAVDALTTRLKTAARQHEEAIAVANNASRDREQGLQQQLEALTANFTTIASEKLSLEERVREADATKAAEIAQVREALEKAGRDALLTEQAKYFAEKQRLTADVDDLKRKLEKQTSDDLGEGAELKLFEELKNAFPEDLIREVPRGAQGADIIQIIRSNGVECGKIIYDSKNRKDWKSEYAAKLRKDQLAEHADHAILSSNKFPAKKKQLCIEDRVIVACPARVLMLATMLRDQVIAMHKLRVSADKRDEKTMALYAYITSPAFAQQLQTVERQLSVLERIDVDEQKTHTAVWEKRGRAIGVISKAKADLQYTINRIVGLEPVADEQTP